jgi:hypothetical protein
MKNKQKKKRFPTVPEMTEYNMRDSEGGWRKIVFRGVLKGVGGGYWQSGGGMDLY